MRAILPNWNAPSHVYALTTLISSSNQDTVAAEFHLPTTLLLPHQTHSTIAFDATHLNENTNCDAVYTNQKGVVCAIKTADCLPILICNQAGTQVAAIHAGWKGLLNGVIENTLHAMQEPADQLIAWMGPAISQTHYEVGHDFYDVFLKQNHKNSQAFIKTKPDKWHADLYTLARIRLNDYGMMHVFGGEHCTYRENTLFHSARRDKDQAGRLISMIWIK